MIRGKESTICCEVRMLWAKATARCIGGSALPNPVRVSCSFPDRLASAFQAPIMVEAKSNVSSSPGFAYIWADSELAVTCSSRSEEHTSELQSRFDLVCRLLLEKKNETPTAVT